MLFVSQSTYRKYKSMKKTDGSRMTILLAFTLSLFLHNFHRYIIHEQNKDELQSDYYFAGMIVPIDKQFFLKQELNSESSQFILINHHPFSVVYYPDSNKLQYKDVDPYREHTKIHNICQNDLLTSSFNIQVWNTLFDITSGIKPQLIKYPGCGSCELRHNHISHPWAPFLGLQSRYVTTYSRATFASILDSWQKIADTNPEVRILLTYTFINTLSMCYRWMITNPQSYITDALQSKSHKPNKELKILWDSANMTNMHWETGKFSNSEEKSANSIFFNIAKHNNEDHAMHSSINDYLKSPIHLELNNKLGGISYPIKEEFENCWIMDNFLGNNDDYRTSLSPFTTQEELKQPLQLVKKNSNNYKYFFKKIYVACAGTSCCFCIKFMLLLQELHVVFA